MVTDNPQVTRPDVTDSRLVIVSSCYPHREADALPFFLHTHLCSTNEERGQVLSLDLRRACSDYKEEFRL